MKSKVLIGSLIFMFFLLIHPIHALTEIEELNKLIIDINQKQLRSIKIFQEKLENYFFDVSENSIKRLLRETTPGEAAAILCFSRLSDKSIKTISNARKQNIRWEDLSKEANVKLRDLIEVIKEFRRSAGC